MVVTIVLPPIPPESGPDARLPLREGPRLGLDAFHPQWLGGSEADQPHVAVSDHLMSDARFRVPPGPGSSGLRALSTTKHAVSTRFPHWGRGFDAVSPLGTRFPHASSWGRGRGFPTQCGLVLVHRSRARLGEAHALEEITEVQNLRRRRRREEIVISMDAK